MDINSGERESKNTEKIGNCRAKNRAKYRETVGESMKKHQGKVVAENRMKYRDKGEKSVGESIGKMGGES